MVRGRGGAVHETRGPRQKLRASLHIHTGSIPSSLLQNGLISLPPASCLTKTFPGHSAQPRQEPSLLLSLLFKEPEKIAPASHAPANTGKPVVSSKWSVAGGIT